MSDQLLTPLISSDGQSEDTKKFDANGGHTDNSQFKRPKDKTKPYKAENSIIIAGYNISTPGGQQITKISGSDRTFAIGLYVFKLITPTDPNKPPYIKQDGISLDHYTQLVEKMGYYTRKDEKNNLTFIINENNIIDEVTIPVIKKHFYEKYVNNTKGISIDLDGTKWTFTKTQLINVYHNYQRNYLGESFFIHLKEHVRPILRDDRKSSYLFFRNYIVQTGENPGDDDVYLLPYSENKTHCIWKDHIIKYDFEWNPGFDNCHFAQFIRNVAGNNTQRVNAMRSALGYLLHNYNSPASGQVVIAYDEQSTRKGQPAGGTGKGIFINATKQLRNISKMDGKKYRTTDQFKWQPVKITTQVVWLDDVKETFPFEDLHSNATDGWNIEYKNKPEVFIPAEESPKIFIASNTVLATQGTTNKRRQFIIEFSNHYSKHIKTGNEQPVKKEHGCIFFSREDWDNDEWNRFYSYMISCQDYYFKNGLQTYEHINIKENQLLKMTCEEFKEYSGRLQTGITYATKEEFEKFKTTYFFEDDFTQRRFSNWIKLFASINDYSVEFQHVKDKSGGKISTFTLSKN